MDSWSYVDTDFEESYQLKETLFSTANGYLGVRGSFEEGLSKKIKSVRGIYINGFYESEEITYGEKLHGFPDRSQSILNVIDTQEILIKINGENFSLENGTVLFYERNLNLKEGVVTRLIHWKSSNGDEVKLVFKRLTSFVQRELFLINISIEPINFSGELELISSVNGDVSNIVSEDDPRIGTSNAKALSVVEVIVDSNKSFVKATTEHSKLAVVGSISHKCSAKFDETIEKGKQKITHSFKGQILKGEKIEFTKYAVYTDTRRHENELKQNASFLETSLKYDFKHFENLQKEYLHVFWEHSDIQIDGDLEMQQGLRFNLFHLVQSVGKDRFSNISAKGLSGEGYEGHYFWDTEIYIFPFFLFTNPDLAKNLLNYRFTILDFARKRAKQMGHTIGALYPWRTIAGDECSPFFPAGTAQYHINVDIAYSIIQYYQVSEDITFMSEKGMEMLIEIARLMHHIGHYNRNDKFCIDAVTGPDEYTCIVNNNYYTNVLTKNLFNNIGKIWSDLSIDVTNNLKSKLKFVESELDDFKNAGIKMFLPFDEEQNLTPQDDSFFNKKVWDFENTPKEKYPLLLNYHPLTLYRHQVCKQADTILGHFLLENESNLETIKNDYNYYEKITTHDSSLSTCIFSIMANRIGSHDKAYDYFMNTARLDMDNLHHNTKDGIHTACMGGSWMSVVFGFAGMRLVDGVLNFHPNIPKKWKSLDFKINFKNRILKCHLERNTINIKLEKGIPLSIKINDTIKIIS
ncbi:glycoside hydrolase family 65 protein [Lutibacter sp.]|uniref:glycoside hydrolase family 65 protein n=1 Tax=Lutibacter sp. TaxID=1925666 RepID=UPI002732CAE9|nr:glycosyl hydrolase family 65 protein [Lutibacter sp.]MDP3314045.1 glycosyl hydrolase family 65 protein [Lutibacter sp.]